MGNSEIRPSQNQHPLIYWHKILNIHYICPGDIPHIKFCKKKSVQRDFLANAWNISSRRFLYIDLFLISYRSPPDSLEFQLHAVAQKFGITQRCSFWGLENGSIRYIAYEFLFVFYCNYGRILCRFRNKARHLSKNVIFHNPLPFNLHDHLESLWFLPKF